VKPFNYTRSDITESSRSQLQVPEIKYRLCRFIKDFTPFELRELLESIFENELAARRNLTGSLVR
jgi:hypothetical protein